MIGGGGYSFVACLSHVTIVHASRSTRSAVPAPIIEALPTDGGGVS